MSVSPDQIRAWADNGHHVTVIVAHPTLIPRARDTIDDPRVTVTTPVDVKAAIVAGHTPDVVVHEGPMEYRLKQRLEAAGAQVRLT